MWKTDKPLLLQIEILFQARAADSQLLTMVKFKQINTEINSDHCDNNQNNYDN